MKRLLIAAGLALTFHAGLFWWGRDWTWDPANLPGINTGILKFKLTTSPAPAAQEEEATITTGQTGPGPESRQKAATRPSRPARRQASEAALPKIEPALHQSDTTTPAAETEEVPIEAESQHSGKAEPGPITTAEEPTVTEPANDSAIASGSESPAAGRGKETGQAVNGTTGGLIAAQPLYRLNPPPPYPPAARQRHYEGTVLLDVLVDEGGKVGELRVSRSSGHHLLDLAALNGVRQWRFEPGRRNGVKIAMWVQIPVRFVLD